MVTQIALTLACSLALAQSVHGQDALAGEKIKGLKGLRSAAVVVGTQSVGHQFNKKALSDIVVVELAKSIPSLSIVVEKTSNNPTWIEVNVFGVESTVVVHLLVHRWVTVLGTKTDLVATTWDEMQMRVGTVNSDDEARDLLRGLLTSFSADYLRANPHTGGQN